MAFNRLRLRRLGILIQPLRTKAPTAPGAFLFPMVYNTRLITVN